ncbi:MAG: PAS domain-containing protein, partial [Alphaproteobacteria bacterium]
AIRESMNGYAWEFSGYPREAMQVQERLITDVQRKVRNTYNLLAIIFLFIVATGGIIAFFVFRERSLAIETQNYLATAIETMPDAFALYDAEDRLVLSNQRFRQNHGLTLEEAQSGPEFSALLKRDLGAKRFPNAEDNGQAWLTKRIARHNNPSGPFEEPFMRDRWLQIAERRTRRGEVVSIATDVTQLKRRELELEESSLRFRQLAEASFDGIVVVEDNRISRFNDHVNDIFGWQPSELQGEPVEILFAPGTDDIWKEALSQDALRSRETLAQHKDGHVFNVEFSSRAITYDDDRAELVFSIRDITERKQAESELRSAKDAAEAGSRAKSDFL